jgi:hypothetical protein
MHYNNDYNNIQTYGNPPTCFDNPKEGIQQRNTQQ